MVYLSAHTYSIRIALFSACTAISATARSTGFRMFVFRAKVTPPSLDMARWVARRDLLCCIASCPSDTMASTRASGLPTWDSRTKD